MSFPFGVMVTVTRQAAPVFPTMGDAPAVATTTDIDNCAIWPTTTAELVSGQDTVTWDLTLVVPEGTDILATDKVTFDSTVYEIVGQPQDWRSPFTGSTPGIVVQLKAGTG